MADVESGMDGRGLPVPSARDKALAEACMAGDAAEAKRQIAAGADPNGPNAWRYGWGPSGVCHEMPGALHMAFRRGDPAVAKVLIDAGADVELESGNGTPMVAWLGMGLRECAALWIEGGGDPWKIYGEDRKRISLVDVACRGGSEELWRLIATRFAPGSDLDRLAEDDHSRKLLSLSERALKWNNMGAIEALRSVGWRPELKDVIVCCHDWANALGSSQLRGRAIKRAKRLFEMGAPLPEKESLKDLSYYMGESKVAEMLGLLEAAKLAAEVAELRRAARAGRASAKKPRHRL